VNFSYLLISLLAVGNPQSNFEFFDVFFYFWVIINAGRDRQTDGRVWCAMRPPVGGSRNNNKLSASTATAADAPAAKLWASIGCGTVVGRLENPVWDQKLHVVTSVSCKRQENGGSPLPRDRFVSACEYETPICCICTRELTLSLYCECGAVVTQQVGIRRLAAQRRPLCGVHGPIFGSCNWLTRRANEWQQRRQKLDTRVIWIINKRVNGVNWAPPCYVWFTANDSEL